MWIKMGVHMRKACSGERQKKAIESPERFYPSHFVCSAIYPQLLFLRYLGALCPGLWGYGGTGERRLSYSITWFCSWSPCANCSIRLCQFLSRMPNLRLRIFVSRLYFCDLEDSREREGLRMLTKAGVQITVMTYKGGGINLYIYSLDINRAVSVQSQKLIDANQIPPKKPFLSLSLQAFWMSTI